jgi:predicted dehydrogenase
VDPDRAQAVAFATEVRGCVTVHEDLAAALATAPDAVAICSPHAFHADQAIAALRAGAHVIVEKPMALTLEDADRMIAAADAAGRVLGVAENEAYEPWVDQVREMVVRRGRIGELAFGVVTAGGRVPAGYPGRRSWLTRLEQGGTGPWMLLGIHTVATIRRMLGEVESVYAREHRTSGYPRPDLDGTVHVLLTLEGGTTVTLVQTAEVDLGSERKTVWLYGDQGVIQADRAGWSLQRASVRPPVPEVGGWDAEGAWSAYALEMAAFARAIHGVDEMQTSGRHERGSLAVVLAVEASLRTGLPVRVDGRETGL